MRKNFTLLFISFLMLAFSVKAQVSYSFSSATATYVPISGGTNPTLISPSFDYGEADEGYANDVPIGFTFIYNGVAYDKFNVNVNGFISLGAGFEYDDNEEFYVNNLTSGPTSQSSLRPIIAPLWDDLHLIDEANIKYQLSGVAPNRVLTVEWANALWSFIADDPSISFQAKLYETTNVIEFIYKWNAGEPSDASASIGLSGALSGAGNFLSLSNHSSSPVVSSTNETRTIASRPATNQVYRFTPLACVAPSLTELTNVTATTATFSWNAVQGAGGYEYAFSTSETPPASGTATAATSVNIAGLTPGVNNYFYVRSSCGGGSFSTWARRATVVCTTNVLPANGATTGKSPTVSWNAVTGAKGYTIMLSTNGVDFENFGSVPASETSLFIENLNYSTTYHFYVRPIIGSDTASTQCKSNATSFTVTVAPIIPCTTNILPADGEKDISPASVIISWHSVPSATGYVVMLSSNGGTTYRNLGYTEDTAANIGGGTLIDYGSTYYYYVRPFIDADTASLSCVANATSFKTIAKPPAPSNDDCDNALSLSFEPVNATTLSATESMAADECNGFAGDANDDIWYKFTALSNGTATIMLTKPSIDFDAVIHAYSGSCGALTLIDCADDGLEGDDETLELTNLVAGQTYYFRVYDYSDFAFGGEFTIQIVGDALPIQLTNFRGERQGSKNVLDWTTLSEQNSKGFELERSADGNNFSSLAFVSSKAANGNSTASLNYKYSDAKPFAGNSYYRLKQVDKDGKFTYSSVVLLKGSKTNNLMLSSLYPNPTKSILNLVITTPANKKINLVVTDVTGRLVLQQSANMISGDNNLQLNVEKLAPGTYMIKAICADGCETAVSKFVKQ
jgi:hypothetical protein